MHEYSVELRLISETVAPETVAREIGIEPTSVRRKGERRSDKTCFEKNLWSLDIRPVESEYWLSLDDGLKALLERIRPVLPQLKSCASKSDIVVWCGHFTSSFDGGPQISSVVLSELGELGAALFLDTYCRH